MASQFVFIDSGIANLDQLLATIGSEYEIVLLNGDSPALDQMANALRGSSNVAAIHLISHGSAGVLELSGGTLDAGTLQSPENQAALATIKASLAPEGDILLYGCEVGSGELGTAFVTTLASLTGADVAASTDLTGATAMGGDSTLEKTVGSIEAMALDLSGYNQVLASVYVSNTGSRVGAYVGNGQTITFDAINVTTTASSAQLIVYARDVDYDATDSGSERDAVYLTGPGLSRTFIGYLIGTNNNWSYTTFDVSGFITQTGNYTVEVLPDVFNTGWLVESKFAQLFIGDGGTYITDLQLSGQDVVSLWNAGNTGNYTIEYIMLRSDGTAVAQRNSSVTEGDTANAATNNNTLLPNSSAGYGSWASIPDGTYTLQAKLIDAAGVVQDSVSRTVVKSSDSIPPSITGPSGGAGAATSATSVLENQTVSTTLTADESVTWTKLSGRDSDKFSFSSGGLLTFTAPTFEIPTDSDGNNTYLVDIQARDGVGNTSVQTVTVTVRNVLEANAIDITAATDTGADDTITYNGRPVITFTGEPNLVVTLKGPSGSTLAASQYSVVFTAGGTNESGTYTVSLIDAKVSAGAANDPFGTYLTPNGAATGNSANSQDGTYTLEAADSYTNSKTVGTFTIDTTAPAIGAFNITDGPSPYDTDTGADDLATSNGNPIIQFTGEAGLVIGLKGPQGTALVAGQHFQYSYNSGVYTVVLLDADPAVGDGSSSTDPFGDYTASNNATGNSTNTADGFYTLSATDTAGNSTLNTFEIDTTRPSITGPSGGTAASTSAISVLENQTAAASFTADETVTWSKLAGGDSARFSLSSSGVLTFLSAPTFEIPTDSNTNNTYVVDIQAQDGVGNTSVQTVTVTVLNVIETNAIDITTATDTAADDTITYNGLPVITFTGEPNLVVTYKGPTGSTLAASQYSVVFTAGATNESGTYTVTLLDAKVAAGAANDPFGTYLTPNGAATANDANSQDGTYTLEVADSYTNTKTAGTFVLDTTPPVTGTTNITDGPSPLDTDTGADDGSTSNGNPTIQFTGEAGLVIGLKGPQGTALVAGQHFQYSYSSGTYTVVLLDADPAVGDGSSSADPFGDYNASNNATGNSTNTADGIYTLSATDAAGNGSTVGTFEIDTVRPIELGVDMFDMVNSRDLGVSADDEITSHGLPVLWFSSDEPSLYIELRGPGGGLLVQGQHYTLSQSGAFYYVILVDANPSDAVKNPFGTYFNGVLTGNSADMADGIYTLSAIDLTTGGRSDEIFEIETSLPNVQVTNGSIEITTDTGLSNSDFITNHAAQTITATLTRSLVAGERLLGSLNDGATWINVSASVTGTAVSWGGVTLQGASSITFKVEDVAGNNGPIVSQAYVLDTSIVSNQVVSIDISQDTGPSNADFITSQTLQTAVTAQLIRALAADESMWARADDSLTWVNISSSVSGRTVSWANVSLAAGANALEFQIRDTAGNAGAVYTQSYQLVSSLPSATIMNIDISKDSGIDGDFITNARSQTITAQLVGTLAAGDRIMGSLDSGTTWRDVTSLLSGSNISWTNASLLTGSGRSIAFKISGAANLDGTVATQSYTLDTTAPSSRITITSISADNGVRSNDFVTSIANQNVNATLSTALGVGDVLKGSLDGGKTWVQIPAGDIVGTSVTWKSMVLTPGQNSLMMRVDDLAGNIGAAASRIVTVANIATFSAVDATKLEGDVGSTTPYTFKVQLLSAALADTTFTWVVDGYGEYKATAADFGTGTVTSMPSGTVTIAAGQTEATISVPVHIDEIWAQDQGFSVKLSLATGSKNVTLSSGTAYGVILNDDDFLGTAAGELMTGSNSAERIDGLAGNDRINGRNGADVLNGGAGADQLTGGLGADIFEFSLISDTPVSAPDRILDFSRAQGDKIDLRLIDAITGGGDNAFNLIGSSAFSRQAGELRVVDHARGQYRVEGDVDGNGVADFAIIVTAPLMPTLDAFWL